MSIEDFSVQNSLLYYKGGNLTYNNYTYEEIIKNKIEGKSCYEYPAPPQFIQDPTQIIISPTCIKKIKEHLKCPLCLNLMNDPVQVYSCLHAFCKVCFDKLFRTGNNKCPLCKVPLSTKRDASKSKDIKRLIELLFPNWETINQEEDVSAQ